MGSRTTGKDATVFAIGGYGSTRSTETPARASTAQQELINSLQFHPYCY
jgi:hypothetical protein